jgi:Tfp pilus assembly protein PilF
VSYEHGLQSLAAGDPRAAIASLRRALYADGEFALAAFGLARAHEELREFGHARRAYERTLSALGPYSRREDVVDGARLDLQDVAFACHTRLEALRCL